VLGGEKYCADEVKACFQPENAVLEKKLDILTRGAVLYAHIKIRKT